MCGKNLNIGSKVSSYQCSEFPPCDHHMEFAKLKKKFSQLTSGRAPSIISWLMAEMLYMGSAFLRYYVLIFF